MNLLIKIEKIAQKEKNGQYTVSRENALNLASEVIRTNGAVTQG